MAFHFEASAETMNVIEQLRADLNAKSNADVFRKALAFAKLCAEVAEDTGVVILEGAGQPIAIDLRR